MSKSKLDPVILPVIRNIMSNIIAEEILSVQPMVFVPLKTGECYNNTRAEFWVSPAYDPEMPWKDLLERRRQIYEWCKKTYGPDGLDPDVDFRWCYFSGKYTFYNEQDRTMFVLRWS